MNETTITKQLEQKQLNITREFNAPLETVWRTWTESELLDQWWAPKPYHTETKSLDFREGGMWLYAMVSPKNEKQWCKADYKNIKPLKRISWLDAFCDENGNENSEKPRSFWTIIFTENNGITTVNVTLQHDSLADLEMMINMGFKEGFTAALDNLDHYLSTRFKLRKEAKTSNQPRVTTYLNFPGKTEEAFKFYQKIFSGEFTGAGLQRFGDIELPPEHPPMSDGDKKLIIFAELTILGGHVLMATDSPESMGFKLQQGNNMHINVEPDSREEAKRIFEALSDGGNVTMPLTDMFWGAYFGTVTDKYGINWMINYQTAN